MVVFTAQVDALETAQLVTGQVLEVEHQEIVAGRGARHGAVQAWRERV